MRCLPLLLLLALTGCDAGSGGSPAGGRFTAEVRGEESFEMEGGAVFSFPEVGPNRGYLNLRMTDPDRGPRHRVGLLMDGSREQLPEPGAYAVRDSPYVATGYTKVSIALVSPERILFARNGQIVLTRVTEEQVEGSFEGELIEGIQPDLPAGTPSVATIRGTFEAEKAEI